MSKDKDLLIFDNNKQLEELGIVRKTKIVGKIPGTDITVFEGSNKVIVGGSAFTAAKHFNITPTVKTPSYNTVLGLDRSNPDTFKEPGIRRDEIVYLFAVGIDGCGIEASQVYDVNYTKWIAPENLVPFRYQLPEDDTVDRTKYFGRKTTNNRIIYYFKAFDSAPVFKQQYTDGTPIDENIYTSERKDDVESYVELQLKLTRDDCKDFFSATVGIENAKVNTISLLTAYPYVAEDGYTYYQNIRPLTKYNFSNESLIELNKGLDIIYQIYY